MDEKTETLPIPDIPDDLLAPVNALLNSARLYKEIIAKAMQGTSVQKILLEEMQSIQIAENVMASWNFKLPPDDELANSIN